MLWHRVLASNAKGNLDISQDACLKNAWWHPEASLGVIRPWRARLLSWYFDEFTPSRLLSFFQMIGPDAAPAVAFLGECFLKSLTRQAWRCAAAQGRWAGAPPSGSISQSRLNSRKMHLSRPSSNPSTRHEQGVMACHQCMMFTVFVGIRWSTKIS